MASTIHCKLPCKNRDKCTDTCSRSNILFSEKGCAHMVPDESTERHIHITVMEAAFDISSLFQQVIGKKFDPKLQ
jgi:hypothetical protein